MGNQIYGMTSSQGTSCEECMQELRTWLKFEEELSGSRLFKVAKARSINFTNATQKIVKIFPYTKASFPIDEVKNLVLPFCHHFANAFNLLPLIAIHVTDHYAFIIREFVGQSLTERLCTRPFLCLDEKRWIAFLLLCALSQLHSNMDEKQRPRCHGDIKSENVLLTSWGWLLLSDAAPFKPVFLPSDNPSEFTYIFDSSRRRVCYLAPERFVDAEARESALPGAFSGPSGFSAIGGFNSLPGFLNLQGEILGQHHDVDELLFGEIADESMECDEAVEIDGHVKVFIPEGDDDNEEEERERGGVLINRKGSRPMDNRPLSAVLEQVRLVSGSYPGSTSSTPPKTNNTPVKGEIQKSLMKITTSTNGHLLPSMDMFSLGCVLLEMFTDGTVAFTLSDLLSYRQHESSRLMKLLASIPDSTARLLISNLLCLNPDERGSASQHLNDQRGLLFPEFFFTDLQVFMQSFLFPAMASPVARLAHLRSSLPNFLTRLLSEPKDVHSAVSVILCNLITSTLHPVGNGSDGVYATFLDSNNTLLMDRLRPSATQTTSFPTTVIGLTETAKVDAVLSLLLLAQKLPSMHLFDRLLPHMVELTYIKHHSPEVRRLALDALTQVLQKAVFFPHSTTAKTMAPDTSRQKVDYMPVVHDMSFLNEFLLPSIAPLASDPDLEVRLAMSRCLPKLSDICLRLSDFTKTKTSVMEESKHKEQPASLTDIGVAMQMIDCSLQNANLDSIFNNARDQLREWLVTLFSDSDNFIRRSLMEMPSLGQLATFFGRSRANDTILSHMVTFLNDKNDPSLRSAFFKQVGPLAELFGAQSMAVLQPLLEQGLSDPEETVLGACLRALWHLQRRRLLSVPMSVSMLQQALKLTAHPAAFIRQACVAYITVFARGCLDDCDSKNKSALVLDDDSIEMKGLEEDKAPIDVELFTMGKCGLVSLYAHLDNDEVNETIFSRPIGQHFTDDAVILSSLHPPLRFMQLEAFISDCVAVATKHQNNPEAFQGCSGGYSSVSRICNGLLEHLQERKTSRLITRRGQIPCYTSPANEAVSELLQLLQSHELTDLMESQLVQLRPLLSNLCDVAAKTGRVGNGHSHESGLHLRGLSLSARPISSSATALPGVVSTPKPGVLLPHARWHSLLPPRSTAGILMRPMHFAISPDINLESIVTSDTSGDLNETSSMITSRSQYNDNPGTKKQTESFVEIMSQRLHEGRIAFSAHQPTPQTVFSRCLTIDFISEATPAEGNAEGSTAILEPHFVELNQSSSEGSNIHVFKGASSSSRNETPPWVPSSYSKINLVVRLHEHKPGHLSLATHPSGRLLASCSSGDGLVKFWDCGRTTERTGRGHSNRAHTVSGFKLATTLTDEKNTKRNDDNESEENSLDEDLSDSTTWEGSDSGNRHASDLMSGRYLPCRASSTYSVRSDSVEDSGWNAANCRHLVWMDAGGSVATIANRSTLHLVDGSVGCRRSLYRLPTATHGLATYLTASSSASSCPLTSSSSSGAMTAGGTENNLLVYSTTNGNIIGHDIRTSNSSFVFKQNSVHGLIRCLAVHSGHTWLSTGTSHGHLVNWDLRYQREISYSALPYHEHVSSIINLKIFETQNATLLVAATDRHNEVTIFDIETSTPSSPSVVRLASTWAQPPPSNQTGIFQPLTVARWLPCHSVMALLALPPVCMPTGHHKLMFRERHSATLLPNLITGGSDFRLRYWSFIQPKDSCVFAWAGHEEAGLPSVSYRESLIHGVRVLVEENNVPYQQQQLGPKSLLTTTGFLSTGLTSRSSLVGTGKSGGPSVFPVAGPLEIHEATRGHTNSISDLTFIHAGQTFLVSAGMNGVINFWK